MTYWDIQTKLILELAELGFHYRLRDRLPIFRLWLKLQKMQTKKPKLEYKINELLELLEYMLAMRRAGMEPTLESPTRYGIDGT